MMNYIVIEANYSRSTEFAAFAAHFNITLGNEIIEEKKNGEWILEIPVEGPETKEFIRAYMSA
jgi:hypothetical protein